MGKFTLRQMQNRAEGLPAHTTRHKITHADSSPQPDSPEQTHPSHLIRRLKDTAHPGTLTSRDIQQLQGTVGNRVVSRLIHDAKSSRVQAASRPENKTGLPDQLKAGIETLSGISLDDVHVHYNSDKPAQLQALAYAQSTDIHVAPGQERHLAHEAWHVVQQKQGRVQPTLQLRGADVNDSSALEREAETMGTRALNVQPAAMHSRIASVSVPSVQAFPANRPVVQRVAADLYAGAGSSLTHISSGAAYVGNSTAGPDEHAERKMWAAGKDTISDMATKNLNQQLIVRFEVNTGICHTCQMWLETVVLGILKNWDVLGNRLNGPQRQQRTVSSKLQVEVKLTGRPRVIRDVAAGATDWSGISYSGSIHDLSKQQKKDIKSAVYG